MMTPRCRRSWSMNRWCVIALCVVVVGCGNRSRKQGGAATSGDPGTFEPVVAPPPTPPDTSPVTAARTPDQTPHPRLILDEAMRAKLKAAAAAGTPAWRRVSVECGRYMKNLISGGYQALQWTEAIANLSLCWHATGKQEYVDRAMVYVKALLDDKQVVGDGKGGDEMVRSDSGYAMRSYGAYTALAYDWLYDAPGMTPELRARMVARLQAWVTWYRAEGYLRDNPYSNYFWGYFAALNFAALATYGDNPEAPEWLAYARDELMTKKVIPGFATALRGGEWAEGWQYGSLVSTELALVLRAHRTATGADLLPRFPWVREAVAHQLHQLLPDRQSVYDNATRHQKPPEPNPQVLASLVFLLDDADPKLASQARYIADELFPRHPKKYIWMTLLGERVGAELTDPRGSQLSNHLPGPGLTIARSSWEPGAVWTSFQAGPKIAVDHQHNDQGHFELWRGADALLVDGGGPFAFATINHNTLLIDDGGRVLNYTPNQGVWARASRTLAFGDDGVAVVAVGDLGDAWAPKCALAGCTERAVTSAVRTFVYVRPGLVVIDDRVEVDRDDVGVTWAAHVATSPTLGPGLASAVIGGSRVDVRTLVPAGVTATAPKEPTSKESHVYKKNDPRGDMWRLEVASAKGSRARAFLHWISADAAGAKPAAVTAVAGTGLRGGVGAQGGATVAVLFSETQAGGSAVVGSGADKVIVAGLAPGETYAVTATGGDDGCAIDVRRGAGVTATSGGFVRVAAPGCVLKAK